MVTETIYFENNNRIIKMLNIYDIDPFSLQTYKEILTENTGDTILFALLICDNYSNIYLAENIFNLRYGRYGETDELCIYELTDPITRMFCTDIHYYRLKNHEKFAKFMGNEKALLSSEYIKIIWDKDVHHDEDVSVQNVIIITVVSIILIYIIFLTPIIIDKYKKV